MFVSQFIKHSIYNYRPWDSILKRDSKGLGKALTNAMYIVGNLARETVPDELVLVILNGCCK